MSSSMKAIIRKRLLVVLAAMAVCLSLGLVLAVPQEAFAESIASSQDTLEQLKQAYLDAQAAYEAALKEEMDAKAKADAKAKDLENAQSAADHARGFRDALEDAARKMDNAEAALETKHHAEEYRDQQLAIANDSHSTPQEKQQALLLAQQAQGIADLSAQYAAEYLGVDPEEVENVPLTYGFDKYKQRIAAEMGVDPSNVEHFIWLRIQETGQQANEAKAVSDEANDAYAAAVKKREEAAAERDAAKSAYENNKPPVDEVVDPVTDNGDMTPAESSLPMTSDGTPATSSIPKTSDGTPIAPVALFGFAGLAIIVATRTRLKS